MDEGPPSLIRIVGGNSFAQNSALARAYESTNEVSLAAALSDKCGKKLGLALRALLLPKADVLAARLKAAMEGWGSDGSALVRILAGVDGAQLAAISAAYQGKYSVPLASALRKELSGNFGRAASSWLRALQVSQEASG